MPYNPNQYGGPPGQQYGGAPPGYGGYTNGNGPPGSNGPPGAGGGRPPGVNGPPPGMAPPGMQPNQGQIPSTGPPSNFQAPPNMPNINFGARVIRLGTGTPNAGGRPDATPSQGGGRPGLGMERGHDQGRSQPRGAPQQVLIPPTNEEKLRTIFLHQIPDWLGGDQGVERLLAAVGRVREWDASASVMDDHKGSKFGFARFEDPESLSVAIKILHEEGIEVPLKKQPGTEDRPEDDTFEGIDKAKLRVAVDPTSIAYVESYEESKADEVQRALEAAKTAVTQVLRDFFYPSTGAAADNDGDTAMSNADNLANGDNVEVVNITLAQDDELADIPAEMREIVSGEIAAFRERSIQRDLEALRKEEEMEERERQRSDAPRRSRLESPPGIGAGVNNVPLGPRGSGVPNAPSGPKGQNGNRVHFVNGAGSYLDHADRQDDETDASDDELNRRQQAKHDQEQQKMYLEAERKWLNRERSRAAALERERDRDKHDNESTEARKQEAIDKDKNWDDEKETSRKSHPYYRDHTLWARKRVQERQEEEARDETDRRIEQEEQHRERQQMDRARGMADSFLDQQADEMSRRDSHAALAPQPFKLSLGAAAQKNQASRSAGQRRTLVDVEGLLDDEEADSSTKRQLIPIKFDSSTAADSMTEEEMTQAVRALAQEIPSEKEGLWNWEVKWDHMDESVIKNKLRPFVEKKIVEYLGVQEEMLVDAIEEHLKNHGKASTLVEELEGALDDEAEDLVKKLWRMVIFFTESEKRGLPA